MIRHWLSGKELMERWQVNPLDLVHIVLNEKLYAYEPDGRLANYEYEDAIRINHPMPFPPLPKKDNSTIYDLIINNEAYDFELPLISIPPDYIPLAKRVEHCMFKLHEVERIEKDCNLVLQDTENNGEDGNRINQNNAGIFFTDEINTITVDKSGSINDQWPETVAGDLLEKSEAESQPAIKTHENLFRNEGEFWRIIYRGEQLQPLKNVKGLHYLAILLQNPDQSLHVLELARLVNGSPNISEKEFYSYMGKERLSEEGLYISNFRDTGQVIDARARSEYKRKIRDLEKDIVEAENNNDIDKIDMLRKEKEFLEEQILVASGLNGRIKKLDYANDRARKSVSFSIRTIVKKIRQKHPELGQHLENSIKTGFFCSYSPENPTSWEI